MVVYYLVFGSFSVIPSLLLIAISICAISDASVTYTYYSNTEGTRVAEVDPERNCHIFRGEDAKWFLLTRKEQVKSITDNRFSILAGKCRRIAVSNPNPSDDNHSEDRSGRVYPGGNGESTDAPEDDSFVDVSVIPDDFGDLDNITFGTSSGFPLIFPGTKWCGAGDIARSADDRGIYVHTDSCCRDHDACPDNIPKGETKHNLTNEGDFTKSHCDCDEAFLNCLMSDKSVSAVASFKIAHVYFNLLKPQCFARRHPILDKECTKRRLTGECVKHKFDYTKPITWQFFPAQPYEPVQRLAKKLFNPESLLPGGKILPSPPTPSIPLPSNPLGR